MRAANVTWKGLSLHDVKEMDFSPSEFETFELRPGDILVGEASGSRLEVGKSAIWKGEIPGACFQNTLIRVRVGDAVTPEYLQLHLAYDAMRGALADASKGIGIHHLGAAGLSKWGISLPPIPEQKRIADKLETLLARVDACRERLDRIPAILKRFRQSVLAAATSGELTREWRSAGDRAFDSRPLYQSVQATHLAAGGHKAGNAAPPTEGVHDLTPDLFPPQWSLATLRDLVEPERPITYGILKPGPELDEGVPYIRVADFPGERLNLATIRKTSAAIDQEFRRSRLRTGDLLLSIRGTVGRAIVIPAELEGANITQDSARLSIQPSVNASFVLWVIRSSLTQDRLKGAIKGVAVRGINIGDVRAIQIPLPSREEQDEIVRRVESLMAFADFAETRLSTATVLAAKAPAAILAKAFRGELVPQDPNDEPAAALLARIAAARDDAGPSAGRTRRRKTASTGRPA